jgi:hypothetical protein
MSTHTTSTKMRRPRIFATAVILATALAVPQSVSAAASTVVKVNGTDLSCEFDTGAANGFMFAITRERTDDFSFAFVDMVIEPTDPTAPTIVGGKDDPALTSTGFHDSWDVANDATGDLIGTATVDASFTGTDKFQVRRVYQDSTQMGIFEDVTVSGRLTVATAEATYVFDLSGCEGFTQDRLDVAHHPNGPRPDTTAPANDKPDGAMHLIVGAQIQESTGGAAIGSEAPCIIGTGDEAFEFPLGRTVWFAITGTGSSITVDPRGSDFDTVVAAYAVGDDGLNGLGCVDDDDVGEAQGLLTFDTSVDGTYLIQIGGVIGNLLSDSDDPQWGRLRLQIS